MNFVKGDIITRADRKGKETCWVSERLVISVCGLGIEYLKVCRKRFVKTVPAARKMQALMPDTECSWRFGKIEGNWYYDIDRIPDTAPQYYRSKLGEKATLTEAYEASLKGQKASDLAKTIGHAAESWRDFIADYAGLRADHAEKLAKSAAILQAAVEYIQSEGIDVRKFGFFADLSALVEGVPYLPGNVRRLKEKVVRVLAGETVTEVVTLPRMGNNNAQKWDDPQVIAWMIVMRAAGVNYSNAHIARKLGTICALNDKTPPSKSWIEHYLSTNTVKQMTHTRYGAGGRRAMSYKAYIPMDGAVFAGDCWLMDATRVNFIEFTLNGNDWQHLMVCMVYDVHSGAIIARSYGTAENRWMYNQALAAAATKTGYLPYEIITDRFPGHNTSEWGATKAKLQRDGVKVTESWKMTGKARLERAIDTVQMVAMQESDKYYGQGIQSRRDHAHRSEEALKAMRRRARAEGWNMERAMEEAEKVFEVYNNKPYADYSRARKNVPESPNELHQASEKPHTVKAETYELLHYFGLSKTIKVGRQGMIVTEILNVKYTYVIDPSHYDAVKSHAQVVMYYDLEDLNTVQLYTVSTNPADEKFLCEATEQKAIRWTGPNQNGKEMGQARARIAAWTALQNAEVAGHVAASGWSDIDLIGTSNSKADREAAETAAMLETANNARRRHNTTPDDNEVIISIRDLY